MVLIADLHIHSKYARACSKDLDIANLEKYARIKGIDVLGTGDFTHPKWIAELKKNLVRSEKGVHYTKSGFPFILQTEISLMYSQDNKGRRVHNLVVAPSFDVVKQITEALLKKGRIDYDGRPIFNIPCPDFIEMMRSISKDIEIIPAHCLLPNQIIHVENKIKYIKDINKGDLVLTHKGRFKKVNGTYVRYYNGGAYNIVPWYFSEGLSVTPEHPLFAIKTLKKCSWTKGLVCKPNKSHKRICYTQAYKNYNPEWICAQNLEKGDVLLYPKITSNKNLKELKINGFTIPINLDFCRLIGYYLSEGYTNNRDAFCFTFHHNETEYIKEVSGIVYSLFNIKSKQGKTGGDLIFYSKNLCSVFQNLFYSKKPYTATNKSIPQWMLSLPPYKQKEILKGWWRGDKGYTTSKVLANQIKIICLRMNIIPSMRIESIEMYEKRGKHFIKNRRIFARSELIDMHRLTFLDKKNDLLQDPAFKICLSKGDIRHGWFDKNYIYLPIRKIKQYPYKGKVYNLEVEQDNSYVTENATVHNCWTPWFAIFGSMSGFNSVEECFKDQAKHVHALETGLSSDPAMNWRISKLDKYNLVSFSDLHSFWPWRIGREVTLFDTKLDYHEILSALRNGEKINSTIEFWPDEGKYHYDGHRKCDVCLSPKESIKINDICPKCKSKLTIGVAHRVEELADRAPGFKPKNSKPFLNLIPLSECISGVLGVDVFTKKVWGEYNNLISKFGNEFNILLNVKEKELKNATSEKIVRAIIKNREQKINVKPGYDGVYGVPLFGKKDIKEKQKGLLEF